eukprot:5818638-Karenia_brevis.AAC.1
MTASISNLRLIPAVDQRILSNVKDEALTNGDVPLKAHLELTSAENAGQWLHVLPNPAFRNSVDPELFTTGIQQWVRHPLLEEEITCPMCEGVIDVFGDHCL